jgi:hypothetical protein
MKALAAVVVIVVGFVGCSTTQRGTLPARYASGDKATVRGESQSTPVTTKRKSTSKKANKPKTEVAPKASSTEETQPLEPIRYEGTFAGSINEKLYLDGVRGVLTIDTQSQARISGAHCGDRVTVLFRPGLLAQVVDIRPGKPAEPSTPAILDGIEVGDRVLVRLAGNAWVTGEVMALNPRVVLDFSHEPKSYVGQCAYDVSSIGEIHRVSSLDNSDRINNRVANSQGHPVADATPVRSTKRGRPVAVAQSRARSGR